MDFSFSVQLSNARFLLQLSTIHFKFPLWVISLLNEDVHLMGQHSPIHPLKFSKVHAVPHLLHSSSVLQKNFIFWDMKSGKNLTDVLEEATSSVSNIKREEPTTSKFVVEKKGHHNQEDSSLYRHCHYCYIEFGF
jgi:hypothetical protein